jgi:hypothetical protein
VTQLTFQKLCINSLGSNESRERSCIRISYIENSLKSMEVAVEDGGSGRDPVVDAVRAYLVSLAQPLLQVPAGTAENGFKSFLATEAAAETLTSFVSATEVSVLFLGFDAANEAFCICDDARSLAAAASASMSAFAVMKNQAVVLSLETGPVQSQLSVTTFNFSSQNVSAAASDGTMKCIPTLQQYTRSFYIPMIAMITRDLQVTLRYSCCSGN